MEAAVHRSRTESDMSFFTRNPLLSIWSGDGKRLRNDPYGDDMQLDIPICPSRLPPHCGLRPQSSRVIDYLSPLPATSTRQASEN